jgi:energy-coupling factor transporter ATP-binding protein EcfA2
MRIGPTLRRLTVSHYRHVAPGTVVTLGAGTNLLLGRNGTGKTTLLELAAAAHALDFGRLQGDSFDLEVELGIPGGAVVVRAVHTLSSTSSQAADPAGGASFTWQLSATFGDGADRSQLVASQDTQAIRVTIEDQPPTELAAAALSTPVHLGFHLARLARLLPPPLVHALAGFGPTRFDEALAGYHQLKQFRVVQVGGSGGAYRHSGVLPGSMLTAMDAVPPSDERSVRLEAVAFAQCARDLMGFSRAEVRLRETGVRGTNGERERELGDLQCFFERADGTGVEDDQLSFGQKRLLAFLYYAECSPTALYADELVNGFHHDWIAACLQVISDGVPGELPAQLERQAVLTSQNPLLVDALGFVSADDASQRIILCRAEERDGREWMVWENLAPHNAASFWRSKEVGLQSVSEILLAHGLW